MATGVIGGVLQQLRRAALAQDAGLTDGELLEAFIAARDEAAFAALARRHGPMVLGVCRRVLGNAADAEDAFQVTFLVLVKKAAGIVPRSMVGNWLYGVAHNTALKAKAMNGKRRVKEQQASAPRPSSTDDGLLRELLDLELSRLPDKYRVPVVLCDLEGKPIKEAARQLGWPQGTVASRLVRARKLLAKGIARHGVVFSGAALAALVAESSAAAAVPAGLMESMIQAATTVAAGGAAAAVSSARAAALFERMMATMVIRPLNAAALAVLAALALGFGAFQAQVPAQDKLPKSSETSEVSPKAPTNDAIKPGRLYFHIDLTLVSVQPDGMDTQNIAAVSPQDLLDNFQPDSARLSPDGKRLAFGKAVIKDIEGGIGVYPPQKLYVCDLGRANSDIVVAELDGTELHSWCWSPDGTRLAIVSWDAEHFARNWVVDLKTKKLREVTLPRYKLKDKEYSMSIAAWSPDGGSFLASGDGLFLVKSDGTGARRLTRGGINLMGGRCRFSPDGRKVLFVGVGDKSSMKLYVTDVAGGKTRAVVDVLNFTDIRACWSPDGRRIAYSATLLDENGKRAGETSLFVMDADGTGTVTVRTETHEPNQVRMQLMEWR